MFDIKNVCQAEARTKKLHKRNKIAQNLLTTLCAIFYGERAETDVRADVKHEISFNRPYSISWSGQLHVSTRSLRIHDSHNMMIKALKNENV